MIYVFIFIGLRVLTFRARYVVVAGLVAALGWATLSAYAILASGGREMITRDYVEYMTSNSVLIGAEADKIIAILVVTVLLAVAMNQARRLVVRSAAEGAAARDLARFFSPEVARQITASEQVIEAGSGEARDAAVVFCDIRGFTRFAHTVSPGEVIAMLTEYQQALVPSIWGTGGPSTSSWATGSWPRSRGPALPHGGRGRVAGGGRGDGSRRGVEPELRRAGPAGAPRERGRRLRPHRVRRGGRRRPARVHRHRRSGQPGREAREGEPRGRGSTRSRTAALGRPPSGRATRRGRSSIARTPGSRGSTSRWISWFSRPGRAVRRALPGRTGRRG